MFRYEFNSKEDFIKYLWFIIRSARNQIDRHRIYLKQLKEEIDKRNLSEVNIKVPSKVYFEFSDKIGFVNHQLYNLLGDHTDKAVSFKKFRVEAMKRNDELQLGLKPLDEKIGELLNEFNSERNWSLHIPESLVNTEFLVRTSITKKTGIEMVFNLIINAYHLYHNGKFLTSLYDDNINLRNYYMLIFSQMKRDYSLLIKEKVQLQWKEYDTRPIEDLIDVEMSAQIQHKEYIGVDEDKLEGLIGHMLKG